jgi:hypothetical protein
MNSLPSKLIGFFLGLIFMAGCTNTPQSSNHLTGTWTETASIATLCGGDAATLFSITANFSQNENTLSGPITLIDLYNDTKLTGSFQATISDTAIKGKVNLVNSNGGNRTYDVDLEQKGGLLQGTFTDRLEVTCSFGYIDHWVIDVALLRKLSQPVNSDSKEPNENAAQATAIEVGESLELTLGKGDLDWFVFEVAQSSTVHLKLDLLTALDTRVWLLKHGQSPQSTSLEVTLELQPSLEAQSHTGPLETQLAPGTYHLIISGYPDEEATGEHSENGKYKLTFVSSEVVPDVAFEPNDTSDKAIMINGAFSEELYAGLGDSDWFSFTFNQATLLTINIESENTLPLAPILYDHSVKQIKQLEAQSIIALQPGKYFLNIQGDEFNEGVYQLNISSQLLPDASYEPNDSAAQAKTITTLDTTLYIFPDDEDWFKVTLNDASVLSITKNPTNNIDLSVYDANLEVLIENESGSPTINLSAGMYYLKFSSPWFEGSYTLQVSSQTVPDKDFEPNDSPEQATPIASGFSSNVLYLAINDPDIFTFIVQVPSLITLRTASIDGDIAMRLSDSNYQPYPFDSCCELPDDITMYVPKGTYYLSMFNGAMDNTPLNYNLALSVSPVPDVDYEPNNSQEQAVAIELGFNQQLYLGLADQDWFRFELSEARTLHSQLDNSSGENYVFGYLLDGQGAILASLDTLEHSLEAGTYYLQIQGHISSPELGTLYTLSLE